MINRNGYHLFIGTFFGTRGRWLWPQYNKETKRKELREFQYSACFDFGDIIQELHFFVNSGNKDWTKSTYPKISLFLTATIPEGWEVHTRKNPIFGPIFFTASWDPGGWKKKIGPKIGFLLVWTSHPSGIPTVNAIKNAMAVLELLPCASVVWKLTLKANAVSRTRWHFESFSLFTFLFVLW
jgi:hypothetical protein